MKLLQDITWAGLASLIFISVAESEINCCAPNVLIKNYESCANGNDLLPKCDSKNIIISESDGFPIRYRIHYDAGEDYLEVYDFGITIHSPNFCSGKHYVEKLKSNYSAAVICASAIIPNATRDRHTTTDEFDDFFINVYVLIFLLLLDDILNLISLLLLAVAFCVYYLVLPTRQIEDNCLLNFIGSLGLYHAAFLYDFLSITTAVPDLCITRLYVMYFFQLSGFAWYALYMYYVWKKCGPVGSLDESSLMKHLLVIGYGAPAILMFLANIHVHTKSLRTNKELETKCYAHHDLVEDLYLNIPIILAIATNCYYWIQLQKYTGNTAVKITQDEDEFNKKKMNSLLTLNRRLFFVLVLPWLFDIIIDKVALDIEGDVITYIWYVAYMLPSASGFLVAPILVMSRARVWTCIIHKYENFKWLQKWQPSDEEVSIPKNSGNVDDLPLTQPSEV